MSHGVIVDKELTLMSTSYPNIFKECSEISFQGMTDPFPPFWKGGKGDSHALPIRYLSAIQVQTSTIKYSDYPVT